MDDTNKIISFKQAYNRPDARQKRLHRFISRRTPVQQDQCYRMLDDILSDPEVDQVLNND